VVLLRTLLQNSWETKDTFSLLKLLVFGSSGWRKFAKIVFHCTAFAPNVAKVT
jgi:hypothetical protein